MPTNSPAAATTGASGALAAACVVTLVLVLRGLGYELPAEDQAIYVAALTYLFGAWLHEPAAGPPAGAAAGPSSTPSPAIPQAQPPAPPRPVSPPAQEPIP